jgi:hypothetical protein
MNAPSTTDNQMSTRSTTQNIGPDDPRYADLVRRGFNKRFEGRPEELYGEVFAELGGVPAPGDETEGALITHPDADLADSAWNTSRVPWHWMYYLGNYGRLQQVKARWDPRNVFQHVLSVRLPD